MGTCKAASTAICFAISIHIAVETLKALSGISASYMGFSIIVHEGEMSCVYIDQGWGRPHKTAQTAQLPCVSTLKTQVLRWRTCFHS